jgi:hypothetical protein
MFTFQGFRERSLIWSATPTVAQAEKITLAGRCTIENFEMNLHLAKTLRYFYQLKLIPLVAPTSPFAPLAPPKKTGSPFFPVSVAAHAPSNNDAARTKTGTGESIPVTDRNAIFSVVNILNHAANVYRKRAGEFRYCFAKTRPFPAWQQSSAASAMQRSPISKDYERCRGD